MSSHAWSKMSTSNGGRGGRGNRGAGSNRGPFRGGRGGNRGGRGGFRGDSGLPGQIVRQANTVPDPSVIKLENAAFSSEQSDNIQSLSLTADQHTPHRPGYGTNGAHVALFANYFQLSLKKSVPVYRYSISVLVDKQETQLGRKKLSRIVTLLLEQLGNIHPLVTDYSANIFTATSLFQKDNSTEKEFLVAYSVEGSVPNKNVTNYRVLVKAVTVIDLQQLLDHLSTTTTWSDTDPEMKQNIIQAMNIILAHGLKGSNNILARNGSYYPLSGGGSEKFKLSAGVEALRGYFLSVRAATGRFLVNAQVKHLATYMPMTMVTLLGELGWGATKDSATTERIGRFIKQLTVRLTHFSPPRARKIAGFASTTDGQGLPHPPIVSRNGATAEQVKFWVEKEGAATGEGSYITVAKHFKATYGKVSKLPVVNVGTPADPKYTLAELCVIPQGEPFRSKLNPSQTQKMIENAIRLPFENARSITTTGLELMNTHSQPQLGSFGLELSTDLVVVDGRVLAPPDLLYANSERVEPQKGAWIPFNLRYPHESRLLAKEWYIIWIKLKKNPKAGESEQGQAEASSTPSQRTAQAGNHSGSTDSYDTGGFETLNDVRNKLGYLQKLLLASGVNAEKAIHYRVLQLENETESQVEIDNLFKQISEMGNFRTLLSVILPTDSPRIYNAIKTAGDIHYGLHTICMLGSKLQKAGLDQYFRNVALKFNLKLGGSNQHLALENSTFFSGNETMVVGLDVTHPAPGETKAPSIACIVASVNKDMGQWPADIRIQTGRKEMIEALKDMIKGRVQVWRIRNNARHPREILVYRDGVSEGQYNVVLNEELPLIKEACKEIYPAEATTNGWPRITVVIVGKRHHTRFFPTTPETADPNGNTKSGTVVDRSITETRVWDFYLQAHSALKGTARPAHYVVVHDEIFRNRIKGAKFAAQIISTSSSGGQPKPANPPADNRTDGEKAADLCEVVTHNMCYLFGRTTKAVSVCTPAYYADIACERARCWLSRLYGEYGSAAGAGAGGDTQVREATAAEVKVHRKLQDTMFYI